MMMRGIKVETRKEKEREGRKIKTWREREGKKERTLQTIPSLTQPGQKTDNCSYRRRSRLTSPSDTRQRKVLIAPTAVARPATTSQYIVKWMRHGFRYISIPSLCCWAGELLEKMSTVCTVHYSYTCLGSFSSA